MYLLLSKSDLSYITEGVFNIIIQLHFSHKRIIYNFKCNALGDFISCRYYYVILAFCIISDLSFDPHSQTITAVAYKRLCFILRYGKYFKNVNTLKLLHCTFDLICNTDRLCGHLIRIIKLIYWRRSNTDFSVEQAITRVDRYQYSVTNINLF